MLISYYFQNIINWRHIIRAYVMMLSELSHSCYLCSISLRHYKDILLLNYCYLNDISVPVDVLFDFGHIKEEHVEDGLFPWISAKCFTTLLNSLPNTFHICFVCLISYAHILCSHKILAIDHWPLCDNSYIVHNTFQDYLFPPRASMMPLSFINWTNINRLSIEQVLSRVIWTPLYESFPPHLGHVNVYVWGNHVVSG